MSSKTKKIIFGIFLLVLVAGIIWVVIARKDKSAKRVNMQIIEERELKALVSASGKIRPKTKVDVSARTNGKILKLAVEEGEQVKKGDFLMQIDPTPARAQVQQIEASVSAAKATLSLNQANLEQSRVELDRQEALFKKKLTSEDMLQKARTTHRVSTLRMQSSKEDINRLEASLATANHELAKVAVYADIEGIVTRRNIEEGENAFVGAFNNPATILLTIADLSVIEAVIEADETDIVHVRVGQTAEVKVDAYPDTSFKAIVTKVGHSPIVSAGSQQQATSFEVILQLTDVIPHVRPGLSCKADITTGYVESAVAVPIQALTIRKPSSLKTKAKRGKKSSTSDDDSDETDKEDEKKIQGVFVVEEGKAMYREVRIGIAGDGYFQVLSGLKTDEAVITGPFKALRQLRNDERVKSLLKKN